MNDFEDSIRHFPWEAHTFKCALIDVNDTVGFVKKILLTNKVQQFTAADVVALTGLVLERQRLYREEEDKKYEEERKKYEDQA